MIFIVCVHNEMRLLPEYWILQNIIYGFECVWPLCLIWNKKMFSFNMASKPINIRWIWTGFQPYWRIMYSIVLETIFHKYSNKNHKINTSFVNPGLGISWDKTMDDKLMNISNDVKLNYPFCMSKYWLKILDTTSLNSRKVPKVTVQKLWIPLQNAEVNTHTHRNICMIDVMSALVRDYIFTVFFVCFFSK